MLIKPTAWRWSVLSKVRLISRLVIYVRIALVNLGVRVRAIRVNPRIYAVPGLDGAHYQKLGVTDGSADNCNGSTPVCFN